MHAESSTRSFTWHVDILTKVDRASMAVSLEVRAPYLDPRVAEFAASFRPHYKLLWLYFKYILKRAAKGLVPSFVLGAAARKVLAYPLLSGLKGDLRPAGTGSSVARAFAARRAVQIRIHVARLQ
jgi:asparagine synthase (glutamine-hydrolysing)